MRHSVANEMLSHSLKYCNGSIVAVVVCVCVCFLHFFAKTHLSGESQAEEEEEEKWKLCETNFGNSAIPWSNGNLCILKCDASEIELCGKFVIYSRILYLSTISKFERNVRLSPFGYTASMP